jgi:hypothetical protein
MTSKRQSLNIARLVLVPQGCLPTGVMLRPILAKRDLASDISLTAIRGWSIPNDLVWSIAGCNPYGRTGIDPSVFSGGVFYKCLPVIHYFGPQIHRCD